MSNILTALLDDKISLKTAHEIIAYRGVLEGELARMKDDLGIRTPKAGSGTAYLRALKAVETKVDAQIAMAITNEASYQAIRLL